MWRPLQVDGSQVSRDSSLATGGVFRVQNKCTTGLFQYFRLLQMGLVLSAHTRYVNVWSDLNGFVLWMVGHCGRWSPRWWVRVVTWHGSCAVEIRVMSPHYSYCARTCQDVRLCLVVCVHPIGIDDPQRMVTAHLVAVAKLVWVREENTDKYHEWGIMICHVHFVFKRQVSRHLLRKKSPVIILKWSEGKWLYILYSCIL